MRRLDKNQRSLDASGFRVGSRLAQLINVTVRTVAAVLAIAALSWFPLQAQTVSQGADGKPAGTTVVGKVYSFEKIADGVYYATSRVPMMMLTGGNNTIIVNERDVVLVDDGAGPTVARALVEDIKLITNKPVRWVINTHYHYDHVAGNSIFGPDVQIIGQESLPPAIMDLDWKHMEPYTGAVGRMKVRVVALKKQIAEEKDGKARASLEQQLAAAQADLDQQPLLQPRAPTITFSSNMTLHSGQREIQLRFLGFGHTHGDTVVFLPKERIVCTGDFMEGFPEGARLSYLGDGVFDKWIASLEALKQLDFDTVLPGHGAPFRGKANITAFQSYLSDLITQVATLRKQGLSAEQTALKVDLTSHGADMPEIKGPGADVRGVRRMYEWMDERAKP
jgi:glyoxylase-like metal-dependent hydrolase (beta-lactamase superfamily II)